MSSILAEKYANTLSMQDFVDLYNKLEIQLGSRSVTAKKCGIERKTIYGWDLTKEIRLKTRERILSVLLEELPEETLDYLTKKSLESIKDILHTYLASLYEQAMTEEINAQEYQRLATKFDNVRAQYEGIFDSNLEIEISEMMQQTLYHANELGLHLTPTPRGILRTKELSQIMPKLIRMISGIAMDPPIPYLARQYDLPEILVATLATSIHNNYISIRAIEPSVTTTLQQNTVSLPTATNMLTLEQKPPQLFQQEPLALTPIEQNLPQGAT